jgi:dipeptidyl-peptidase 4
MVERYFRAAQRTPPKFLAALTGNRVEGYWLDPERFFFVKETIDSTSGRRRPVPCIANCRANRVDEVIRAEELSELLAQEGHSAFDEPAMSSLELNMADDNTLVASFGGVHYRLDVRGRRVEHAIRELDGPALYSPDGQYACYVSGFDLWVQELASNSARPLTSDGAAHRCYGQQSETGLYAVSYRKRPAPIGLWSRDSQWFLTHCIDERPLPEVAIVEHCPDKGERGVLHTYKYPLPGDPLPLATFVAIHVASRRTVRFETVPTLVAAFSPFFTRLIWFGEQECAWLIRFDRYFKRVELVRLDFRTAMARVILTEEAPSTYLDLHPIITVTPNVRTLERSGEVIWFSELDGWGHLYLYDLATGVLKNRITQGEWLVRDIVHVDEVTRRVFFLAGGLDQQADPGRRVLCVASLDGSGFKVLSRHEGDIFVPRTEPAGMAQDVPYRPAYAQTGVSPDNRLMLVRYNSLDRGNRSELVDFKAHSTLNIAASCHPGERICARHFGALAADGVTLLHGAMFLPSDFDEKLRYPLIDYIYPGPQITHKPQSYATVNALQASALAELGFVVIMLDTRGMPARSRELHQMGYGQLLQPQLDDHAAVARELCDQYAFIDRDRIGMIGESAGGAATARALCEYNAIYSVGVSVCGNHDSSAYSSFWSDKYRGPGRPEDWGDQSNLAIAHKLKGKLLLISGDMDENVCVTHTFRLADALIKANKDFDLLIVPNAGHNVLTTNGYAQRRVWDYLVRHLLKETPPSIDVRFESEEVARAERAFWLEVRE